MFAIIRPVIVASLTSIDPDMKLWYNQSSTKWTDALPIGNGRLGAMVYGIYPSEMIQLNEETVRFSQPNLNVNPEAKNYLQQTRDLLWKRKWRDAEHLIDQKMWPKANQVVFHQ
jgi:alpha-L-fucosidase 2